MRRITVAAVLFFLFIVATIQAQSTLGSQVTDSQRTEIEKTLTEIVQEMSTAVNQLSTAGIAKYASESFQEYVNAGNIVATSKEANLKLVGNWFSQRKNQTFSNSTVKVFVLSPELAYVVTVSGGTVTLKTGRLGGFGGAMTMIWRKEPGGWKYIHVHESMW
jgi:ketosteroid isomerase-like protein